jgi:hypothetical protein
MIPFAEPMLTAFMLRVGKLFFLYVVHKFIYICVSRCNDLLMIQSTWQAFHLFKAFFFSNFSFLCIGLLEMRPALLVHLGSVV